MARRRKEDAEKTRARILASALSLFSKKGYEKTTLTDIAARLKLTKGAVYWHFDSKKTLLTALIDEMCQSFSRQLTSLFDRDEKAFDQLSFPEVAEWMIRLAVQTVSDPRRRDFFLLMHEQIRWSSTSMDHVREDLLRNKRNGPWEALHAAVANDIRAGRVRADVSAVQIASCCLSLWNGLVHSAIAHFLACDLQETLTNAYTAIWRDISIQGSPSSEGRKVR